VVSA
jgi:serine/threonine protein kinase